MVVVVGWVGGRGHNFINNSPWLLGGFTQRIKKTAFVVNYSVCSIDRRKKRGEGEGKYCFLNPLL